MNLIKTLKSVYGNPKYIALNLVIGVAYYFVIKYLLSIQQQGIPITSVPLYLIYLLIATTSITLTLAVYSIANTRKNYAKYSASSISAVSAIAGGVLSGCSCQAAILFGVLSVFVGTGEATLVNTIVGENAPLLFGAMIIINLFVVGYYLDKLSKPACRIKTK